MRQARRDGGVVPVRRITAASVTLPRLGAVSLSLIVVALAFPGLISPQEPTTVAAGARVRVKAEGAGQPWFTGRLLSLTKDSVRLLIADSADSVALATSSLSNFEVSRGKRPQARRGALYGAGVGAILAGVLAAATYEECENCFGPDPGPGGSVLLGAVLGGVFGLGVGALIGRNIKGEHWAPVPRPWAAAHAGD